MSTQGTATIDFGAFPGTSDVTLAISVPSITGTSLADAWIFPVDTVSHSIDEHIVDPPNIFVRDIVAGVGFTIHAITRDDQRCYGTWSVAWVCN